MLFRPPDRPLPPFAPDEEDVRPRRRLMPAVAASVPWGQTLAKQEAPSPTENCDYEKVQAIFDFGCDAASGSFAEDGTRVYVRCARAAHMVVGSRLDRGFVVALARWVARIAG